MPFSGCRNTIISPYLLNVRIVSLKDSPFCILDTDLLNVMTFPPSRYTADSNDIDVRVLGSKKAFINMKCLGSNCPSII